MLLRKGSGLENLEIRVMETGSVEHLCTFFMLFNVVSFGASLCYLCCKGRCTLQFRSFVLTWVQVMVLRGLPEMNLTKMHG